jgi:hypothetical protein
MTSAEAIALIAILVAVSELSDRKSELEQLALNARRTGCAAEFQPYPRPGLSRLRVKTDNDLIEQKISAWPKTRHVRVNEARSSRRDAGFSTPELLKEYKDPRTAPTRWR